MKTMLSDFGNGLIIIKYEKTRVIASFVHQLLAIVQ